MSGSSSWIPHVPQGVKDLMMMMRRRRRRF